MDFTNAPAAEIAMQMYDVWEDIGGIIDDIEKLADTLAVPDDVTDEVSESREYRLQKARHTLLMFAATKLNDLCDDFEYIKDLVADTDADKSATTPEELEEQQNYILKTLEAYEEDGDLRDYYGY